MDSSTGFSPALLVDQTSQNELVRRKLEMDSLRKRLGDTATSEQKLRESCEGFEAIFLQKMWEQMRKSVPKEGFMHSKDEEMYQSLFDVELCKKMAGAGGIGLADMLYEQLSQQLVNSGRTTSPGSYRIPLEIAPAGLAAVYAAGQKSSSPAPADEKLTAEYLYSSSSAAPDSDKEETAPGRAIEKALHDLKLSLEQAPQEDARNAVGEWARFRDMATGMASVPAASPVSAQAEKNHAPGVSSSSRTGPEPGTEAAAASGNSAAPSEATATAANAATGSVAPAGQPEDKKIADATRLFGRRQKGKAEKTAPAAKTAHAQPRGMAPEDTLWPLANDGGVVVGHFGWEDDKTQGRRQWSSGVRIAAPDQSPVRAVLEGTVVYAGQRDGFGNTVVLEHRDGFRSYYSNLGEASVRVGDKISRGSEFAKITMQAPSQAGRENSASLFFELKKGEMALNPENAIARQGA